jgi:hypothetical protein
LFQFQVGAAEFPRRFEMGSLSFFHLSQVIRNLADYILPLAKSPADEQHSRRPIFIATLWAAASWLFFRVARSSRIDSDMLVARALKNSQLTRQPPGETQGI